MSKHSELDATTPTQGHEGVQLRIVAFLSLVSLHYFTNIPYPVTKHAIIILLLSH